MSVRVIGFDHIVLNVADTERALDFYCGRLGMAPVRVEEWRRGEVFFPSARASATTIIDFLPFERSGENANHFCLVVEPADFDAIKASGDFDVVDGPDTRFGAQGDATSLYVKDPDGNVVELRYY